MTAMKKHMTTGPTSVVPQRKLGAGDGDVGDLDAQRALGRGVRATAQRVGQRRLSRLFEAGAG